MRYISSSTSSTAIATSASIADGNDDYNRMFVFAGTQTHDAQALKYMGITLLPVVIGKAYSRYLFLHICLLN